MRPEREARKSEKARSLRGRGSVAKVGGPVQQRKPSKCPASAAKQRKSRRDRPGGSLGGRQKGELASAAPPATRGRRLLRAGTLLGAHRAAFEAAIAETFAAAPAVMVAVTAERVREPRQDHEAMLLRLVEALVERLGRIGELLECRTAALHRLRAHAETLDRILRLVGAGARGEAVLTLLGEIAQRALDGRPVLLLVGRQLEARMQRGDARVSEGADVLRARTPVRTARSVIGSLLRVSKGA